MTLGEDRIQREFERGQGGHPQDSRARQAERLIRLSGLFCSFG